MKTKSANYTTYDIATKKPVVIVEFNGITRKYSSQTFNDINSNYKKYITSANYTVPTLDLLHKPISAESSLGVTIVDKDADVTSQLSSADFEGRGMTFSVGFQELNKSDFIAFPEQKIRKIIHGSELLSYNLISKDAKKKLQQNLFREAPKTALNGAITATATTITVDDASILIPTSAMTGHNNLYAKVTRAVKIGSEIIKYGGISGNNLTSCTRGKYGTGATAHEDGEPVIQFYIFQDQNNVTLGSTLLWSEVLLYLLMTGSGGAGHAYYDLSNANSAFDNMGCGLNDTEVDIATIERLGYEIQHDETVIWGSERPLDAVSYIEEKILRPFALFMYVDTNNKLTVNSFEWVHLNENFSAVDTLGNTDIKNATVEQGDDDLINFIRIDGEDTFLPVVNIHQEGELDSSVTAYGKIEIPLVIRQPGQFVFLTNQRIKWELSKWLYFWGNIPAYVTLSVKFTKHVIEVGDYIQITYDKLPDIDAGTIGWTTKKALVIGKRDNFGITEGQSFEIDCITWENVKRVTNFYTVDGTIAEGSITRKTLTYNSTNDDTLDANDAYHDFANTITPDAIICTVEITPPNSGTTHHSISLQFRALENITGTYTLRGNKTVNSVRIYSGDSTAFTVDFFWISTGATSNVDRVKVDWYANTALLIPAETPTMKITQIKHLTFNENITLT